MNSKIIKQAFVDSSPALFGYVPLGIAFGIISFQKTQCLWLGPAMSLFVYAGAAQYMSLGVIAASGTFWDLFLMTFIVNFRHIFYGIPFLKTFSNAGKKRPYLIFSITDETYSILTTSPYKNNVQYCWWVSLLTHGYWVGGTLLGGLIGPSLHMDTSALDFTLTALFVILTIEQAYTIKAPQPFVIAMFAFASSLWASLDYFITLSIFICVLFTLVEFQRRDKNYVNC